MRTWMRLCGALLILACGGLGADSPAPRPASASTPAAAGAVPAMVPIAEMGGRVLAPAGWSVQVQETPIQSVAMEETPGASTSPSIHLMVFPLSQGAQTPSLYAQEITGSLSGAQRQQQQTEADGSVVEIWTGDIDGVPAQLALQYGADPAAGMGMLSVFAAPPPRFAALGGVQMLQAIFPATPPAPAPAPTPQASGLEWHRCVCREKQFSLRATYTVCSDDPVGASLWSTIAYACLPDGCTGCACTPQGESCGQDGQML